jgi:hypothetical protein
LERQQGDERHGNRTDNQRQDRADEDQLDQRESAVMAFHTFTWL